MAKRFLWVDTTSLKSDAYRYELEQTESGLSIDILSTAYHAVERLVSPPAYDAVFLQPEYLTYGKPRIDPRHQDAPPIVPSDMFSFGFWFYERLRKSPISDKPLFVLYFGLSSNPNLNRRFDECFKNQPRITLVDLLDTMPAQFIDIVNRTLSK